MDKLTVYGVLVIAAVCILLAITILPAHTLQVKELPACNLEPRDPPPIIEGISWNLDECYYFLDDPSIPYVTSKFTDFADNFSTCSSATFEHTMITDRGNPVHVTANITDDCKIHVINDNIEGINSNHRKLVEGQCEQLKLEEEFIDFTNCTMSENEHGSFRVWK